ncbi:transmembrane protein, putative (macronuclear) [Tetrahymena thermophila SB210]|uniref:Transmembrane protein, putative n=1 Tax=Tetrahymena thermophila (strain SB210) TaxID=312017 RepID=W7WZC3_TETTS|nr:transmembrane protein, putative [Tetrahymena thermophila SB210]EWS72245.1 transmembrane protein, putative [Tetrahymena thermophila SB210]|eukprot:XP_012655185.1 transmembrane protein, putative [Tetrahymena thermophila SB210]
MRQILSISKTTISCFKIRIIVNTYIIMRTLAKIKILYLMIFNHTSTMKKYQNMHQILKIIIQFKKMKQIIVFPKEICNKINKILKAMKIAKIIQIFKYLKFNKMLHILIMINYLKRNYQVIINLLWRRLNKYKIYSKNKIFKKLLRIFLSCFIQTQHLFYILMD